MCCPNGSTKVILLLGKSWPPEIQAFVDVADVQIGGSDYKLQVLAYNCLIMAMEMSANDRENCGVWNY